MRSAPANCLRSEPDVLPIAAIAGTRGKSTVAWMLSAILTAESWGHASWLSSGVYVGGELQRGELGPWSRIVRGARHGELDAVIQEMNAATVVGAGLPERSYPLAILTTLCGNHEACLLNPDTELERRGLAVVARAVRHDGLVIVNADDYDLVDLTDGSRTEYGPERVLFALHRDNPAMQRGLASGGRGAWVDDGVIVHGDGNQTVRVLRVDEIPATLDGTILFQAQNALAAICAAIEIGVSLDAVRTALRSFEPDPTLQPAACNIVRYNQATLLVDAPRQIGSLRLLARGIRHKRHRRTLVVSGAFPGLSDDDLREAGRVIGGLGGIVLLHSENGGADRMEQIKQGISSANVPPLVLSVPDELRAIDHVLNTVAPGDLALVIADNALQVLARLWPAPAVSFAPTRATKRNAR